MLYVYFDLEATGLSTWHDNITQIGAMCVRFKDGEHVVVGNFETYVLTSRKICEKASEKTGITNEDLKDAPKTKTALMSFFDWIAKSKQDGENVVLVAYNGIGYDYPLLLNEMYRWDINIPRQFKTCCITFFLDPLKWARSNMDQCKLLRKGSGKCSFSLGDVHLAITGNTFDNAHTALADTMAMYNLCTSHEFGDMCTTKNSPYCMDVREYTSDFMIKRKSVDTSLRRNIKNRFGTLFENKSIKKKQKRGLDFCEVDESQPKKKVKTCVEKDQQTPETPVKKHESEHESEQQQPDPRFVPGTGVEVLL